MICSTAAIPQERVSVFLLDSANAFSLPFIKIINHAAHTESLSGLNGKYVASPGDSLDFQHFLYKASSVVVGKEDSIQLVYLNPIPLHQIRSQDASTGALLFQQYQDSMRLKSYRRLPYLKFENRTELKIYTKARSKTNSYDLDNWEESISLLSIEENKFEGSGNPKQRVVYSETKTADTIIINNFQKTLIPAYLNRISPTKEYYTILENDYYNPLYRQANRRYIYSYLGQISIDDNAMDVVLVKPKKFKQFSSIIAVLYFDAITKNLYGSSYRPAKSNTPWQLSSDYITTRNFAGFQNSLYFESHIKKIPKNNLDTRVYYQSIKDRFQFDKDSSVISKTDFRLFQSRKDSIEDIQDEYHELEPEHESERLKYLKRDTSESGYVNTKWYDIIVNLALEQIGLKVGPGYFNNIFKLNQYESVRIGIGYQSINLISDRLKFGGYIGYGFKDARFKFGYNAGLYIGKGRKQYLEYTFKNDILEPGRTFYFYEKKDLIRNFFTSRVGLTVSRNISYTSSLNKNYVFSANIHNYSFDPKFEYAYQPTPEDSITFFRFTELGFKMRIGRYSAMRPSVARLLLLNKVFIPVFYINYVEGFDNVLNGEYAYRKLNAKIKSYFAFSEKYHLDLTTEAGIATKEIPYPVLYAGSGNISELASIMVQDAFQTMDLYDYLTDRYVNVFTTFFVNFKAARKTRMRPQVGFAWNMGWGKLNGNPDIHKFPEGEGIRDYRNGFYEVGVLFTNFLQVRLFGLIRGQFGLGAFYNVGETDNQRFALRVTYKITTF